MGWGARVVVVAGLLVGASGCVRSNLTQLATIGTAMAVESQLRSNLGLSSRIMGRPDTVEATHALAISGQYPDCQSELVQPGDDDPARWPAEYAEELDP